MFFDLFYVAASYNCSYILVDEPSALGFLYFVSTFVAVMNLWKTKTFYDACFVFEDDLYHRVLEVAFLGALAAVIVNTRTVKLLSYPSEYVDMFAFCLSLCVAYLIGLLRQIEVGLTGVGQTEVLKQVSKRNSVDASISLVFQVVATILAGLDFYGKSEDGSKYRLLGEESSSYGSANHLPIIFTLLGPILYEVRLSSRAICFFPSDGSHKEMSKSLDRFLLLLI